MDNSDPSEYIQAYACGPFPWARTAELHPGCMACLRLTFMYSLEILSCLIKTCQCFCPSQRDSGVGHQLNECLGASGCLLAGCWGIAGCGKAAGKQCCSAVYYNMVSDTCQREVSSAPMAPPGVFAMLGVAVGRNAADTDWLRFEAWPGTATVQILGAPNWGGWVRSNLNMQAELRVEQNGQQLLLATRTGIAGISTFTYTLTTQGIYYLSIRGIGTGSPATPPGHSNYGSIGQYQVLLSYPGTVCQAGWKCLVELWVLWKCLVERWVPVFSHTELHCDT